MARRDEPKEDINELLNESLPDKLDDLQELREKIIQLSVIFSKDMIRSKRSTIGGNELNALSALCSAYNILHDCR